MVALARSAPVGNPPLVARMDTARFGVVPVQLLQNRSRSTRVRLPLTPAVNVWPAQLVALIPKPLFVTVVFCWSILAAFSRVTSPGLLLKSQFVATPLWKSGCVVSVMQPFDAATVSTKSCVTEPASGTTIPAALAELNPAKVAVSLGYVPAGTLNEYVPSPAVVVDLLPRATVAPPMGLPLPDAVTVPCRVPFPTVVQPGNWNAPMRV